MFKTLKISYFLLYFIQQCCSHMIQLYNIRRKARLAKYFIGLHNFTNLSELGCVNPIETIWSNSKLNCSGRSVINSKLILCDKCVKFSDSLHLSVRIFSLNLAFDTDQTNNLLQLARGIERFRICRYS